MSFKKNKCEIIDANNELYATAYKDKKGMYRYDMTVGGAKIKLEPNGDNVEEEEAQVGELEPTGSSPMK